MTSTLFKKLSILSHRNQTITKHLNSYLRSNLRNLDIIWGCPSVDRWFRMRSMPHAFKETSKKSSCWLSLLKIIVYWSMLRHTTWSSLSLRTISRLLRYFWITRYKCDTLLTGLSIRIESLDFWPTYTRLNQIEIRNWLTIMLTR